MLAYLMAAGLFIAQGTPVGIDPGGTITGTLRSVDRTTAVGVRVAAMARPDEIRDLAAGSALAGLGETDAAGKYRLENIPPGRYYIIAGRVDTPTFYPGTVQATEGVSVTVTSGLTLSGIDFVLNNVSAGRAAPSTGISTWVVPIQTQVEGGGKVPLFSGGHFPMLRFTRASGEIVDVALNVPNVSLVMPTASNANGSSLNEFRISVQDLPDGYELKSLTFGAVDLKNNPMRLNISSFNIALPVAQSVSLVLVAPPPARTSGVRVAGRIRGTTRRSIYISGNPGSVYADGTFEFFGVLPGIHSIVSRDNPLGGSPQGIAVVVGTQNLVDVELEEISNTPLTSPDSAISLDAGNRPAGTRLPLRSIRGQIVDAHTHEPLNAGRVVVNDSYTNAVPLDNDGRFEISKLLPGRYIVEVFAFGIGTVRKTVVLEEQDANLDLSLN